MTAIEMTFQIEENISFLRPFARRFTNNLDNANDLIQDTIVKALVHKDKFKDGTNFRAWLYTIMRNTFITGYQKLSRKKTVYDPTADLHLLINTKHSEENRSQSEFISKDITNALSVIPEINSTPFVMYFEGFKYHEIADELQIPLGTVKNRIFTARQLLKVLLKDYQFAN